MIENYSNTVVRFLNNKEETKKEVEALIYEMLEERFGEKSKYTDEEIIFVLKELGDPYILAMKYTNLPKRIVSEKNIYSFYYIFIIIMIIIGIGTIFSIIYNAVFEPKLLPTEIIKSIWHYIFSGVFAFGALAFVFMLMEHFNKEININKNFNPKSLAKVDPASSDKKAKYPLVDSILEIFFGTFFLIFINFYFRDIYFTVGGEKQLIFNTDYLNSIMWIMNLTTIISILGSVFKITKRKKTISKELVFFILDVVLITLYTIILTDINIFSDAFITFLKTFEFFNKIINKYNMIVSQYATMGFIAVVVIIRIIALFVSIHRILTSKSPK